MFEQEKRLLNKIRFDWNTDNFCKLIDEQVSLSLRVGELRKQLENVNEERVKLSARLKETKMFNIEAPEVSSKMFNDIWHWSSLFAVLHARFVLKHDDAQDLISSREYKDCERFNSECNELIDKKEPFESAVGFYEKFKKTDFSEANIDNAYLLTSEYEKLSDKSKSFLPGSVAEKIKNTTNTYNKIKNIRNVVYARIEEYIRKYDPIVNGGWQNSEQLNDCIKEGEALVIFAEEAVNKSDLDIAKVYADKYAHKINGIICLAQKKLSSVNARIKKEKAVSNAYDLTSKICIGATSVIALAIMILSIVNVCITFCAGITPFFGVLFGIIVGILFGVLRLAVFCGFGALWWPGCVSTLFFGTYSESVNGWMIALNVVIYLLVAICFFVDYKRNVPVDASESAPFLMLTFGMMAFIVFMVYGGIAELVVNWQVWPPISVICGIVYGLFRMLMLIIGAGFWWPDLYAAWSMNGLIVNICFYALVGLVFLIYYRIEEA